MLRAALIAFALAITAVPASADTWDDAMATYQAGDYETAARMFRTVAKQGDAWAQYNLGVMYDDGEGVPHDFGKAMKWYRMAAEHTHSADRKRVVPNTRPHEGVITRRGSTGQ